MPSYRFTFISTLHVLRNMLMAVPGDVSIDHELFHLLKIEKENIFPHVCYFGKLVPLKQDLSTTGTRNLSRDAVFYSIILYKRCV